MADLAFCGTIRKTHQTTAVAQPDLNAAWYGSAVNVVLRFESDSNPELPFGLKAFSSTVTGAATQEDRLKNEALVMSFGYLPHNWNGYGAPPIPTEVVEQTRRALRLAIEQPPEIFPTGRESVQFEYSHGKRTLEVEIAKETISFLMIEGDVTSEWEGRALAIINEAIARLHATE